MAVVSTCALVLYGGLPASGQAAKTKAAQTQKTKPAAKQPIDVNTASEGELQELPGIGPVLAKEIIEGRPYASVEDLDRVKGLGPAKLAELKGMVKASRPVSPPAKKTKAAGAPSKPAAAAAHAAPIDLNTATAAELEELPGIGPVRAKAIIDGRPYSSVEDLARVKGFSESKIEDLTDLVVVRPAAATTPKGKVAAAKPAARPTAVPKTKTALPPGHKINVNTASVKELEELPLIGPVKAQGIVDGRPFETVEDLKKVRGIGEVTFERIKDMVTVK
jgi:competence protein ComEA